jgi:hypothetical protein
MPIGKDSIKTRVAKVSAEAAAPTVDLPAEPVAEPAPVETAEPVAEAPAVASADSKPAPKKRTSGSSTRKKPAAPKAEQPAAETAAETAAEPTAEQPATAVLSNVAPETVEAVVGHKEGEKVEHVQVGQKMPNYLL